MSERIRKHTDLIVFSLAFEVACRIYALTKNFPIEERYSLTDQIRRSSRSVCANIAEAWRKRRYPAAFISKLNDAEAEAAETQVWLAFCQNCEYLDKIIVEELLQTYNHIIGKIVTMIRSPDKWSI